MPALALLLAAATACASAPERCPPPLTTADPYLVVMGDPEAAMIVARHAPLYGRLIDQQVTPPPSPDLTLDDMLDMPALQVTAEGLAAISRELAEMARRRCREAYRTG